MKQVSWILLFLAAINFAEALVIINYSAYDPSLGTGVVVMPIWVPTMMLMIAAITSMITIMTIETYEIIKKTDIIIGRKRR